MCTRILFAPRIRFGATLGLLAVFSIISSRAASAADVAAKPPKSWHVEGRVVDEKGAPVVGVDVFTNELPHLKSAKQSKTKSGSDGRFQLDIAHQIIGRTIRASQDGGQRQAAKQLPYELNDGKPVPPVELVLQPAREITGTVTDSNSKPVPAATVLVTAGFELCAQTTTDDSGHAKLLIPAKLTLQYAVALKPGVGLDYWEFRRPEEPKNTPYKLAADHSAPLSFVLNGTRNVTVRAVSEHDKPLAGVSVSPWLIRKPNKGSENDELNLSGLPSFNRQTNELGIATFDYIPSDNTRHITFWAKLEGYFSPRSDFDPGAKNSEVLAKLTPLVKVTGRVTLPDGKPAADIEVTAAGAGYTHESFNGTGRTDQSGGFSFNVYPDQYYQFAAGNRDWASPSIYKIVRAGKPVDGLLLKLEPAVRVFGRMTVGPKQTPSANSYVQLYTQDTEGGSYYRLPKEQQLPNPKNSNIGIGAQIVKNATTDAQGAFEFFASPGKYYLYGRLSPEPIHVEVAQGNPVEVNFHADHPEKVPISGRVVLKEKPDQGVPNAKIYGQGTTESTFGRLFSAISEADGTFQADRGPFDAQVFAQTPDRKLAGIVKLGPDDTEVTIPIEPTGSAHGRIIDEDAGGPAAERQIDYGIRIDLGKGMSTSVFGGHTKTDANGEFAVKGLVIGREFTLSAVLEKDDEGHPRGWRNVGKVIAANAETVELGDLTLMKTNQQPTTKQRVAKLFADPKSLEERLTARLRDAKFGYQRVLMIFGDPTDSLVTGFYELEHELRYDHPLHEAMLDYLFLPTKNTAEETTQIDRAYAAKLGIEWPSENDAMLVVFDENGTVLSKSSLVDFLTERKIDVGRLAAFLKEHSPTVPDAEQLLADALAKAKREDKRVLVQVSGPRCGWCTVLSRYLDDHHDLIDNEFTYVKLDDRLKNGVEVTQRVRPKKEGGVPWMVILDADGKPLITSDDAKGENIGYPGEPEGQVHFEKMLRTSTKHLTDADIKTLIAALAKDNK